MIVGVDEAGRGALAGPVVAAAVAVDDVLREQWWSQVRDSKKIGRMLRSHLDRMIRSTLPYGIGAAGAREVDAYGIDRANALALRRALANLTVSGEHEVFVDGSRNFGYDDWNTVVHGDGKVWAISAASVLAKEERDRRMRVFFHGLYPAYGFDRHVGYGTEQHYAALAEHGPSEAHRRSFRLERNSG